MSQLLPYVIYAGVTVFDRENPMKNIFYPKRNATPGNSVCDFNENLMAGSFKAYLDPPFSVFISHEVNPNRIKGAE